MSSRTLPKKLASVKPGALYAGVDLALDSNVVVVLDEGARQLARFRFPNDRDGYDFFYGQLERLRERHPAPEVLVGMEPTNYFWKLLAADLEQHQYGYRLVNPYTVKKHRDASLAEGILDPGSRLPEPAQLGSPAVTWVPGPFRLPRTRCVLVQERASGSDAPQ